MSAPTFTRAQAHNHRKAQDARKVLTRAVAYDIVVEEISSDGTPMTHIERVRTFIDGHESLSSGDAARVRITDVGDSWARAIVLYKH